MSNPIREAFNKTKWLDDEANYERFADGWKAAMRLAGKAFEYSQSDTRADAWKAGDKLSDYVKAYLKWERGEL